MRGKCCFILVCENKKAIDDLKVKVDVQKLGERIDSICASFIQFTFFMNSFCLVIALCMFLRSCHRRARVPKSTKPLTTKTYM